MGTHVYNKYMRKLKIFITVFTLYEFVMLTILQINNYCINFFNLNFCESGAFKYFVMCIMLPISVAIFLWWVPEIGRLFCSNTCETPPPEKNGNLTDVLREIISKQDIERLITAAIIMSIQKFAQTHPETNTIFGNIFDALMKKNNRRGNKKI